MSRTHRRAWTAVVVACLSLATVGALAAPVDGQSARGETRSAAVAVSNTTVSTASPAAGEPFSIDVTISNSEGSTVAADLNQLTVTVGGDRRYVADRLGTLSPGSETTVTVPVTLERSGQRTIVLSVFGNTPDSVLNVESPVVVDVRDPGRPGMSVSVPDAVSGASRTVNVTVANGIDGPIRNVVVTVDSPSVGFDERKRVRGELSAGETRVFGFPGRIDAAGRHPIEVTLGYTDDGRRRTVNRTFEPRFDAPANPGRMILAGVEAVQRGGTVELSATASNVGGTEVGGVVVTITDGGAVRQRSYFVGSVEASGFSTFTIETSAGDRLDSLPVRISYVTGGVERTVTTEVPVDAAPRPEPRADRGGGPPFALLGAGALGLAVLVGGGIALRRRG